MTVSVALPVAWPAGAVIFRTAVCPAVIVAGLKVPVTPLGRPDTPRVASWANPFELLSDTANAVDCPWITFALPGVALMVKPEAAWMVSAEPEVVL